MIISSQKETQAVCLNPSSPLCVLSLFCVCCKDLAASAEVFVLWSLLHVVTFYFSQAVHQKWDRQSAGTQCVTLLTLSAECFSCWPQASVFKQKYKPSYYWDKHHKTCLKLKLPDLDFTYDPELTKTAYLFIHVQVKALSCLSHHKVKLLCFSKAGRSK